MFSQERCRKISLALRGKKLSLATRRKISQAQIGRHLKEETKRKLSLVFKGRKFSEEWREKIRQARLRQVLPLRDTEIEKMLQIRLLEKGIIFETHKAIVGQPDIFIPPNICIFCDGDYWHANPKFYNSSDIIVVKNKTASEIWQKDTDVERYLEMKGYKVFRFWEADIRGNADSCIDRVLSVIQNG
jgi:G:T-mismatch repair DNA endonuclease (very short patch repair protein)